MNNIVIASTVHNDGRETELLALDGTLPVVIRGKIKLKVSARCGLFWSTPHLLTRTNGRSTVGYYMLRRLCNVCTPDKVLD